MRLIRVAPFWGAVMWLSACAPPLGPAPGSLGAARAPHAADLGPTGPGFALLQAVYASDVENEIRRLTDQARALNGNLSALLPYREFRAIARTYSRAMATRGQLTYMAGWGPRLGQRVTVDGNAYRYVGRNIRRISPGLYAAHLTLYDTQSGWLNQPRARATLLSPTAYAVGVGAYRGADGYLYITQAFFEQLI